MSKKGRKVYRTNSYEKKKRLKKFFQILLALTVIAGFVFVGYSVGEPIIEYLKNEKQISEEDEQQPWTPAEVTGNVTSLAETEDNTTASSTEQASEAVTEEVTISDGLTAFVLPEDTLANPSQLSVLVENAKSDGYNAVSVTLKAKGGKIYYRTESTMAALDENAVVGVIPIEQVVSIIENSGLKMIGEINILEDNNRYGEYRKGSYHMLDGSTWLDSAASSGGKPWLSPFEEDTKEYVRFLVDEAANAGFDYITISGLKFPDFYTSDLNYIGDSVKSADRYKALSELIDIAEQAASNYGTKVFIKADASDIIYDKCEFFRTDILKDKTILINYEPSKIIDRVVYKNNEISFNELNNDVKFKTVFEIINDKCGNVAVVIPLISENGLGHAEYDALVTELINEGFTSYLVK